MKKIMAAGGADFIGTPVSESVRPRSNQVVVNVIPGSVFVRCSTNNIDLKAEIYQNNQFEVFRLATYASMTTYLLSVQR